MMQILRVPTYCCALLIASGAFAQTSAPPGLTATRQISLEWDPSPSAGVVGYKAYFGSQPHTYGVPVELGNQTYFTVEGLPPGTWYFAVTAKDAAGMESGFSNEASETIAIAPATGPAITQLGASVIATTAATITWVTSEECSGTVLYGTDPTRLLAIRANNLGTTDHLAVISPLLPRTHYVYRVESVCAGQTIESEIRSFNTK
jgi:hypothetical protein